MSARAKVVDRIADHLAANYPGHPLRIGVDGITAAGKSTIAAELADAMELRGRPAIHLSMDGFHHPRAHRYRQGHDSARGYYEDAYDFDALVRLVLAPLGPGGDLRYRPAILDLATDAPLDTPAMRAPADAVVIVDGTFLQRANGWDEVIFVDTNFDVASSRAALRDCHRFGGADAVRHAYQVRYHAACRLYLDAYAPADRATVLINNDDLEIPVLCRIGGRPGALANLFSYGTLQQSDVQLATFGRLMTTRPDRLVGYRKDWLQITDPNVIVASGSDRHPIVRPSGDRADSVSGVMLVLTGEELAAADTYEASEYRRMRVTLASGAPSWVYVAGSPPVSQASQDRDRVDWRSGSAGET